MKKVPYRGLGCYCEGPAGSGLVGHRRDTLVFRTSSYSGTPALVVRQGRSHRNPED
jgi:hypothetical protein